MTTQELLKVESYCKELFSPNPSKEISTYCDNIKQYYLNNIDKIQDLFISLTKSQDHHFKFWLLDIMIIIVKNNYKLFSPELKNSIRQSLLLIV